MQSRECLVDDNHSGRIFLIARVGEPAVDQLGADCLEIVDCAHAHERILRSGVLPPSIDEAARVPDARERRDGDVCRALDAGQCAHARHHAIVE